MDFWAKKLTTLPGGPKSIEAKFDYHPTHMSKTCPDPNFHQSRPENKGANVQSVFKQGCQNLWNPILPLQSARYTRFFLDSNSTHYEGFFAKKNQKSKDAFLGNCKKLFYTFCKTGLPTLRNFHLF